MAPGNRAAKKSTRPRKKSVGLSSGMGTPGRWPRGDASAGPLRERCGDRQRGYLRCRPSGSTPAAERSPRKNAENLPSCLVGTLPSLPLAFHDDWLTPHADASQWLLSALRPYPAQEMEAVPVSSWVNNARREGPECIQPEV